MSNSIPAPSSTKKYIMIAVVVLVILMCCSSFAWYMSSGSPAAAPVSSGSPAAPVSSGSPAAPVSSGSQVASVPVPTGTVGPVAAAPVPTITAYVTYANTECYSATADIGYQGKLTSDQAQAACAAKPSCAGAVQHPGGDWWLLSSVHANAGVGNSPNNQCIVAPGNSLV